jgi:hypothetical protein
VGNARLTGGAGLCRSPRSTNLTQPCKNLVPTVAGLVRRPGRFSTLAYSGGRVKPVRIPTSLRRDPNPDTVVGPESGEWVGLCRSTLFLFEFSAIPFQNVTLRSALFMHKMSHLCLGLR